MTHSTDKQCDFQYRVRWIRTAVWLCLSMVFFQSKAQNPHFSQYYASPLYVNPALAGKDKDISFACIYRSQWASLGFPQNTGQVSVTLPLLHRNPRRMPVGGFGLSVYDDRAGQNFLFHATGANVAFAYNFPSPNEAQLITIAGQAGIVQKRIDSGRLQWGSQYDPLLGFNGGQSPPNHLILDERVIYPVLNAGIMWYSNPQKNYRFTNNSAFAGLAVSNINHPDESFITGYRSRLPLLYKLHGGTEWRLSHLFNISPNLLLMHQYNSYQVNVGTYLTYKGLSDQRSKTAPVQVIMGTWYRLNDSFIITAGMQLKKYAVGISYDLNVSSLHRQTRSQGALEFSLTYRISKNGSIRNFSTPLM